MINTSPQTQWANSFTLKTRAAVLLGITLFLGGAVMGILSSFFTLIFPSALFTVAWVALCVIGLILTWWGLSTRVEKAAPHENVVAVKQQLPEKTSAPSAIPAPARANVNEILLNNNFNAERQNCAAQKKDLMAANRYELEQHLKKLATCSLKNEEGYRIPCRDKSGEFTLFRRSLQGLGWMRHTFPHGAVDPGKKNANYAALITELESNPPSPIAVLDMLERNFFPGVNKEIIQFIVANEQQEGYLNYPLDLDKALCELDISGSLHFPRDNRVKMTIDYKSSGAEKVECAISLKNYMAIINITNPQKRFYLLLPTPIMMFQQTLCIEYKNNAISCTPLSSSLTTYDFNVPAPATDEDLANLVELILAYSADEQMASDICLQLSAFPDQYPFSNAQCEQIAELGAKHALGAYFQQKVELRSTLP